MKQNQQRIPALSRRLAGEAGKRELFAMRQMMGVFLQLERGMIVARMQAGRHAKAMAGGYAGGRPPYGFRAEGGKLVPDEDEQRVIDLVRPLRREGFSLRQITLELEAEGYAPRSRSGRWHPYMVARILEAEEVRR